MLEKITLKNFQAHKESTIEFSDGITAIVGSSDSGKTSILRALYWLLQNKPNGIQMVSYWNRKKDGTPKEDTTVSIQIDDHTITRVRNQERNGYDMDSKELSAIGRGVPESITDFLNLSDINISKQFDAHFLLSESAGEVARRLNEMVRLDIIDETLSKIKSLKEECKKSLTNKEKEVNTLTDSVNNLSWVTKAEKKVKLLQDKELEHIALVNKINSFTQLVNSYTDIVVNINKFNKIKKANELISKIEQLNKEREKVEEKIICLNGVLANFAMHNNSIEKFAKVRKAKVYFELLDELRIDKEKIDTNYNKIKKIKCDIISIDDTIKNVYILIDAQRKEMDTVELCPTCGAKLKGDIL